MIITAKRTASASGLTTGFGGRIRVGTIKKDKSRLKSMLKSTLGLIQAPFTALKQDDDSNLVTLIAVARDNQAIRDQLVSILRQTPFQRQSMINTWLADLELAGAPTELRDALSSLLDENIADRALVLLTETRTDSTDQP
jgi:hypothetical protein